MSNKFNNIHCSPRGWWFFGGVSSDQWTGPFDTPEEAEEAARSLLPTSFDTIVLLNLQLWEKREVQIEKRKKCPHCKDGFIRGRCCRTCEGTGRLEV